jgi:hypothetical protein
MADSGGRAVLVGVRKGKERGGGYRPDDASRRFRPSFVAYRSDSMGAGRSTTCGGRRPMEQGSARAGECDEAAWHRPRQLARVTGLRRTVPTAPASDRRSQAVIGLRARVRRRGRRGARTPAQESSK